MANGSHPKKAGGSYCAPGRVPQSIIDQEAKEKGTTYRGNEEDCEKLKRIEERQKQEQEEGNTIPVVNMESDRVQSIIKNTPAIFEIKDNPDANGKKPMGEVSLFNPIDSGTIYNEIGAKYDVNPDWLKAIAYLENTHGFYDGIPPFDLVNTSYRPMNVQYKKWKPLADQLGFTEWQVEYRVQCNVELAALIIRRIMLRVPNATLEKVASIYNYTGKEKVSDYGARVKAIYEGRLWEK